MIGDDFYFSDDIADDRRLFLTVLEMVGIMFLYIVNIPDCSYLLYISNDWEYMRTGF